MRLLLLYLLILVGNLCHGQDRLIFSTERDIYEIDVESCEYKLLFEVHKWIFDIAWSEYDQKLYAITYDGELFTIDLIDGTTETIHTLNSPFYFNSLVADEDGLFYIANLLGQVFTYNIKTNQAHNYGTLPSDPEGDLVIIDDILYFSGKNSRIYKVQLFGNSFGYDIFEFDIPALQSLSGIYGLANSSIGCDDNPVFAFNAFCSFSDNQSELYKLDFNTVTSTLICDFPLCATGATSIPQGIVVEVIDSTSAACAETNGAFSLAIYGNSPDYSVIVNGEDFGEDLDFEGLIGDTYNVEVIDEQDCTGDITVTIPEEYCKVYIPNAFSPNLDSKNEIFRPFFKPSFTGEVLMFHIYNRRGNRVFEQKNFNLESIGWDGTMEGQALNADTYAYFITILKEDGSIEEYTGDVTLIR